MSESSTQVVLPSPNLDWRDGQPFSNDFNDPYFSSESGLEESRYVFAQHNGIVNRWQQWPWQQAPSFNIIETGFGTGLNFLATWQLWRDFLAEHQPDNAWLHFSSIEKFPLSQQQLSEALDLWPELTTLSEKLLKVYPLPLRGAHQLVWPEEKLSLTLWFMDVQDALPEMSPPVHAWYLDGFAPSRNPEMWSEPLFKGMRFLSQHSHFFSNVVQPSFATFTAAGIVKRGLRGAGFTPKKSTGFGRKRDMMYGHYDFSCGPERPWYHQAKPWLQPSPTLAKEVAIIGAGLAGCFSARALAERGFKVRLFDPKGIANEASGNAQGGLYIKLSAADSDDHSHFYLSAYQYALQSLERYLGAGDSNNNAWQQCGLLQLAFDDKEQARQQRFLETHTLPNELLTAIDAKQASQIANAPLPQGGLFFPQGAWVSPKDLCLKLVQHHNIELITDTISALNYVSGHWQLTGSLSNYESAQVVLANAINASQLLTNSHLPLKNVRGQLSYLDAQQTPHVETVVSGSCYLAPALNQQVCLGATFNLNDNNPEVTEQDHLANLKQLASFGDTWTNTVNSGLKTVKGGRVGFRCSAPDYLPVVGSLPNTQLFLEQFQPLVKDSKAIPKQPCQQLPGLWLNIAHGAKGLVSTPLCAELLASQMSGSALPCSLKLVEALWPGRFLLRDMVRKKITL